MIPWTVAFVKRGTLEMCQRQMVAPHDKSKAWDHISGLIDDGWLLCMTKGSHEFELGTVPIGKQSWNDLRRPDGKQIPMFATRPGPPVEWGD
jgi:hypothetical protein